MSKNALLRSRHNNYLTLPVLFIMISSHYPMTYGHAYPWLVLATLSLGGVFIRHYFNIRHLPGFKNLYLLAGIIFILLTVLITAPISSTPNPGNAISTAEIHSTINQRCLGCHAEQPKQPGFTAAPLGMIFETETQIEQLATEIHKAVVITRTMPLANLTGMTDQERELVDRWYKVIISEQ